MSSGGQVLHGAADLARLLGDYAAAPGEMVVQKVPVWDSAALWLLLLGLLAAGTAVRLALLPCYGEAGSSPGTSIAKSNPINSVG